MVELINADCMQIMSKYKDKHFELAIVDPPYGVGNWVQMTGKVSKNAKPVQWNNKIPTGKYFTELKRVSNNQIIWGWNYYTEYLGSTNNLIYWGKSMGSDSYSAGEIAYTSFSHSLRQVEIPFLSESISNRVHPCQKPVKLYAWLLKNYAKPGDKILDTHGGSGSSAIAAHKLGFDMTWIEIDSDYYKAAVKRFKKETAMPLFDNV